MLMRDTEGYIYQGGIGKLRQKKKKSGIRLYSIENKREIGIYCPFI